MLRTVESPNASGPNLRTPRPLSRRLVLVAILLAVPTGLVVTNCFPRAGDYLGDSDEDGVPDIEDCAPEDPTISPRVDEICDDCLDNDCDGLLDDQDSDCRDTADTGEADVSHCFDTGLDSGLADTGTADTGA